MPDPLGEETIRHQMEHLAVTRKDPGWIEGRHGAVENANPSNRATGAVVENPSRSWRRIETEIFHHTIRQI